MATSSNIELEQVELPQAQAEPALTEARVSVVIPCYNEERFIEAALRNLVDQYQPSHYEIIVVDGNSEDRTREVIAAFSKERPDVSLRVVSNPARTIPRALNTGIAAATGDIIVRLDAHAVASPGYVRRCVEVLEKTNASLVGGPCRVCPGSDTSTAAAIAIAVSHPFGIGDAKYRLGSGAAQQEEVDTVAFCAFRKSLWQKLGGYNEELLTNEDYDFNYRVRLSGGQILLDRAAHCDYFSRATFRGLATQYLRYGSWKARMVRLHPKSIKLRHLVAPLFVGSIVTLGLLGVIFRPFWWLLGLEVGTYVLMALYFGYGASRRSERRATLFLLMPLVFLTIHLTWGGGFIRGLFSAPK